MRAIYTEGMLPIKEICDLCGLTAKQARDNVGAAKLDGLLIAERDDVTASLAYKLTAEGKTWVTERGLHLKNSKASRAIDAEFAESAAEIAEVTEDTLGPVVDEAPSVAATEGGGEDAPSLAATAEVDDEPAHVTDATTIYSTVDNVGHVAVRATLDEAIARAKDLAKSTGSHIPVYRMILVGKTRTTVDFVAEEANA
jgi:hypothetical protein